MLADGAILQLAMDCRAHFCLQSPAISSITALDWDKLSSPSLPFSSSPCLSSSCLCSIDAQDWDKLDWQPTTVHSSAGRPIQAQHAPLPGEDPYRCASVQRVDHGLLQLPLLLMPFCHVQVSTCAGAAHQLPFAHSCSCMPSSSEPSSCSPDVHVMHWRVGRLSCTFRVRVRHGWADLRAFL